MLNILLVCKLSAAKCVCKLKNKKQDNMRVLLERTDGEGIPLQASISVTVLICIFLNINACVNDPFLVYDFRLYVFLLAHKHV